MGLSFLERKQLIMDTLEEFGTVKVTALAKDLAASEITIRRDLDKLGKEGLLTKTHGGATSRETSLNEFAAIKKIRVMEAEKKRIGEYAAKMVNNGDVIFLDSGTTTLYIARACKNKQAITIITNSVLILSELRFAKDQNIILLGGNYRSGFLSLTGPLTERSMAGFRAGYAFVGSDGITSDSVTCSDIYESHVSELMIRYSEKAVLVSDHSKIGRRSSMKYAGLDDFDLVITDKNLSSEQERILDVQNTEVVKV